MTTETEFPELFNLEPAKRLQVVFALWDSLARNPGQIPMPEWQKEELDRRWEAHLKDPENLVSWEDVKQETRPVHA